MKKLGKLGVAVALAGLFVVGCGDSGLVKLENKNPTIDQKKYDLYVEFLNKKYGDKYDFYHISSLKNLKAKDNKNSGASEAYAEDYIKKINDNEYFVFAVGKNDKEVIETIKLKCGFSFPIGKCDTIDDISYLSDRQVGYLFKLP